MSVSLTWIGLDDLKEALRRLPAEMTELAAAIAAEAADRAAAEIRAAYPEGDTGNLRKGVRVRDEDPGPFRVRRSVRSTAPHAILYERGTQTRQTALGYHRGHMFSQQLHAAPRQGANIFIPIVEQHRRAMFEDLVAVVEEAGIHVRR